MNRIAAKVSIAAVIGYVAYSGVVIGMKLASAPWHHSRYYTIGGSAFAVVALVAGIVARLRGPAPLDSNGRQLSNIGIVAGLSYLGYLGITLSKA